METSLRACKPSALLGLSFVVTLLGCFPTPRSPRIDPGLRLSASAVRLADQTRNERLQRTDYLAAIEVSYGFGDRLELGVPLGLYWEDGLGRTEARGEETRTLVLLPYLKLALLPTDSKTHLAASLQAAWFLPANVGIHVGRDLGSWEPYVGLTWIASGGPAGDDPVVTRYQEASQLMFAPKLGATWLGPGRPQLEAGWLVNHYREGAVYGDFGQPTQRRTLVDFFLGLRLGIG